MYAYNHRAAVNAWRVKNLARAGQLRRQSMQSFCCKYEAANMRLTARCLLNEARTMRGAQ